ncbi:MAG: NAD(P)/FAD-dependent oxidoreductase [candidate division NC10 bacterium]|nr:NAD(P)/FAD-dependent oxidoreductase [candidate division NC10 bacterium]
MPQIPVIVIGAGPAGSVLAGLLAQRGVETLLLDKATFPREKICGDYLSPGTVRLLGQLDLLDLVRSAGARRLRGMTVTSPDGTTFTAEFPSTATNNGASPFALSIPRAILDSLLLKWARRLGVRCLEGFRVTDLIGANGRICGVTGIGPTGSETYRGQIVVGADGRDSVVARRLDLYRPHPTLRRMALVAYYEGISELTDHGLISVGDRSYCILNPVGERLINASIVVDQGIVQGRKGQLDDLFDGALQAFPLALSALHDTGRRGPIRCLGPLAFRSGHSAKAGVLLIGDAAGFYDPFTGEGVGHALYSARLAAHTIGSALDEDDSGLTGTRLAQFDRQQRKALKSRERLGAALQAIIRRPLAANAVARLLRRHQPLADLLLGVIGDLLPPHALFSPRTLLNVLYRE